MELEQICQGAKAASQKLATLGTNEKNRALTAVASALVAASADIIAANKEDLENGKKNHMPEGLLDRLMLNEARIAQIAEGLQQVAALDDPIGEVLSMKKRPNGLMIGKKRVPLGVVGMIYEARPNVTVDAFGLCFKTGNAVILKGGSDAIHSNIAIVSKDARTAWHSKRSGIFDRRYVERYRCGIYENEPVCRCTNPTWWGRTDPCGRESGDGPCDRNRNRKLPYFCG